MKNTQKKIVLASTSIYRQDLLKRLQLDFISVEPKYQEKHIDISHRDLAARHAYNKAMSLVDDYPDSLIIGSDQVLSFDNQIFGKPKTTEKARLQLAKLSGNTHQLITAVSVIDTANMRHKSAVDIHEMTMRALSARQIEKYVAADNPINCAGSYMLESLGISLFWSVTGTDDTAVIGLPLLLLVDLLKDFGVDPL